MKTTLILVRHGATRENLAHPPILLGRTMNPTLAPEGMLQSEAARDALASRRISVCYTSPMLRARQTAEIICQPHSLEPEFDAGLTECDLGQWEGRTWESIRESDPEGHDNFMRDPAEFGYLGGENFAQVTRRSAATIDKLVGRHQGGRVLVVTHNIVARTFLAHTLGLLPGQARRIILSNAGISVITRSAKGWQVEMVNSSLHLPTWDT